MQIKDFSSLFLSLRKIDAKLFERISWFQNLLENVEISFQCPKKLGIMNVYFHFLISRAPPFWILWRQLVAPLFNTKDFLLHWLPDNSCNQLTSWNPKWRRPGHLKLEISVNNLQFFVPWKDIFTFWSKFWNLVIISNNLASICRKSGGSL